MIRRTLKSALFKVISNTPPFHKLLRIKPNTTAFENYFDVVQTILKTHQMDGNQVIKNRDLKKLHRTFRKYNVSTRELGEEWWRRLFELLNNPVDYDDQLRQLICLTKELDHDILSIREWCHIYAFTTRLSLFELSFYIRKKAVEHALTGLDESSCIRYDFEKRIGALIETGDLKQAYNLLKLFSERFNDKDGAHFTRVLSEFIHLLDETFEVLFMEDEPEIDLKYRRYISGKSVAVVGPAVVNLSNAEEINGFDEVLRFNYREKEQGCDPVFNGEKTTITHFNNVQTEHVIERFSETVPIDVNWVLIKKERPFLSFKEAFRKTRFCTRQLRVQNGVLFYGTLHAVPNTICDMLRFGPDKIKIFNADLMITGKRHDTYRHEGYPFTERLEKLNEFAQSNAWHDVVAQYNLLNLLWKHGKISGDSRFEEVIQLTPEQYIKEVEIEYGYGSNKMFKKLK